MITGADAWHIPARPLPTVTTPNRVSEPHRTCERTIRELGGAEPTGRPDRARCTGGPLPTWCSTPTPLACSTMGMHARTKVRLTRLRLDIAS
jgi:hypothetical protein